MDTFAEIFDELDDPRTGNAKQHDLNEILLIALCAILCGGETCADMPLFGRAESWVRIPAIATGRSGRSRPLVPIDCDQCGAGCS